MSSRGTGPEVRARGPEPLPTGVPGLDRILNGGLRRGGLHVAIGRPGAGKSVLAHQIGATCIRAGGKVLYLTALVETHGALISQARSFRFYDPGVISHSFYYASLYPALAQRGMEGAREEISRLIAQHGPSLVILDGLHAVQLSAPSSLEYQRFVHELEAHAAVSGVTMMLLTHPARTAASDPTLTIADGILRLRTERVKLRSVRLLSVEKLRGVGHIDGWHTFSITPEGIHVYPRLESLVNVMRLTGESQAPPVPSQPLLGFEAEGVSEMLGGGVNPSSVTLIVGTPGSGKTLLCLSFLSAGIERGEPGLYFGFHESPERLIEKAEGIGLPLRQGVDDGTIHLAWQAPSELLADRIAEQVLALVEKHGVQRLIIDSVDEIRRAALPGGRDLPFLSALADLLREKGVAALTTQNTGRIVGVNFDLPMAEISPLMDNLLHTRTVEQGSELRRMISVLKMRARGYDPRIRELHISETGLRVGDAFDRSELLLSGLAWPVGRRER